MPCTTRFPWKPGITTLVVPVALFAAVPQARIKIDIDRVVGEVHPHLFGNFAEHLGRCIYGGIYDEKSPLSDADGFRRDVFVRLEPRRSTPGHPQRGAADRREFVCLHLSQALAVDSQDHAEVANSEESGRLREIPYCVPVWY
ncbi:MAG: hypothetical protein ACKV22_23560 [Bryobacteraceae bacterium]